MIENLKKHPRTIVFTEGITRQLFVDMGLTIGYSLAASLVMALTVVPAMASKVLTKEKEPQVGGWENKLTGLIRNILEWCLRRKGVVVMGTVVLLVLSTVLSISKGTAFMPEMDSNQISMTITPQEEMALEDTAKISDEVVRRLETIEDIQDIGDEQDIYKLLVAELPLLNGSDMPDDWAVDPSLALEYFNKMISSLPDYIGAVLSPLKITPITFDSDQASDVSKIQKATQAVLNTSGGSQVLNGASISGTTAWTGSIKADSEFAISMLLPQTEATVNRLLSFALSNPSKIKFFEVENDRDT